MAKTVTFWFVGAVVLADSAVIGRVSQVYAHSAEVETLAAPGCRFSVVINGTPYTGVIHGKGGPPSRDKPCCQVDFLPKDMELSPEQHIVTSGLGGWLPPGLPVGLIKPDSQGRLFQIEDASRACLQVEPFADFGIIHFVTVICPLPRRELVNEGQ